MNGKQTLQKKLQSQQTASHRATYITRDYVEIGSWRFEENEDGDLVIVNIRTQKTVTLIKK